jgi:hypothetical protein
MGTAQAHEMLYDQDGYKLAVGIEAGLGGFAVANVDTNAGNINTDAPLEPVSTLRAPDHEGLVRRLYQAVRRTGNAVLRFRPHLCSGQHRRGADPRERRRDLEPGTAGRAIDHL